MKKFEKAFHTAYLKQQNLEPTKENIELYSSEGELKLLYETPLYYVILNHLDQPENYLDFINVVWKDFYKMESIEAY